MNCEAGEEIMVKGEGEGEKSVRVQVVHEEDGRKGKKEGKGKQVATQHLLFLLTAHRRDVGEN